MALIFIDGFDHYDTALDKWDAIVNEAPTFGTGRFSGQSVQFKSTNSRQILKSLISNVNEVFTGFAFQAVQGLSDVVIASFQDNVGTKIASLKLTSSGALSLHLGNDGTQLDISSASVISAGIWHYIEMHYHPDSTSGTFEVKVNEVVVATTTGVDTTSGLDHVRAENIGIHNSQGIDYFYDDFYVLDETGSINTTYLGDVRVVTLAPDADTATKDFTPDTGSENFSRVDETPTIDDDTSFVENGSTGATDLYSYASVGVSGTVHGVQVNAHARKTDSKIRKLKLVAKPGSTESVGPAELNIASNYFTLPQVYETNPDTSIKWTVSEVDSGTFGFKVTT